jgi:hypothetical protein
VAVDLSKRSGDATVSLLKHLTTAQASGHDLGEVTAQVVLVFDYSGSMAGFFERGEVQELTERILGLSLPLDDDGNIQVFPFDHRAYEPFVVDARNYAGVIEDWRYERGRFDSAQQPTPPKRRLFKGRAPVATGSARGRRVHVMGGTDYTVVIEKILTYTSEEGMLDAGKPPVFVLFQSDGGTSNPGKTQKLLTTAANLPVFWQFLGLGPSTSFLSVLDDLPGRVVDNVGLTSVPSVNGTDPVEFYDRVTEEFVTKWIPAARAAGVLKDRP